MFDLSAVQSAIQGQGLDGWLLYDFRGLNVLARRVVGLGEEQMLSRRWFYYIPARGEARKLCHRIEPHALDALPGSSQTYLRWQELEAGVGGLVQGARKVAMEYVPRNANPYVSRVDAGTIELVHSFGVEIVPSGDLVQLFEACWDDDQWTMHLEAAKHTRSAYDVAFRFIAERVRRGGSVRETEVQQCILDHFQAHGLVADHPPICAVGPHSAGDHFEQLVIAEVADTGQLVGRGGRIGGAVGIGGQAQVGGLAVEPVVVSEEGAEPLGQIGVALQQRFPVRHHAGFDLLQVLCDDPVKWIAGSRPRSRDCRNQDR